MRQIWDIHGGIHPEQNKEQSTGQAIRDAGLPDILVLPLSQHIGAPATAIVEVGDKVLKGQVIASPKGLMSVPVHASSSGEIIAIEDRLIPHPSGMSAPCIVIASDGRDQWTELRGVEDYKSLDKPQLLNIIRNAGIAGMGGAGFPSAVKLTTRDEFPIDTLIINGTECEPYITSDDMLMRERAREIITGTEILRHLINPSEQTLIAVEDNKPEAIAALQQAANGRDIEIVSFPTKYPSGGEKQLIQILTGREVPSGGLPSQVGIICQNIGSTAAIYNAVTLGRPLISRITTITGEACEQQANFEVLLGTPVAFLLALCGYKEKDCSRLIMGGPMMGFTLKDSQLPIVKTSNCILAPSPAEIPKPTPAQACIRCGMCEQACPVSLLPQQMYWFARGKEYEKLEAHNLMDCIECGACSYVCPSNIPLVQYYRASKADIRLHKQEAINAEHSKARFEARQDRIERIEAEKIAKREARKAAAQARAANSGDGKVDAVQAAIERAKAKKAAQSVIATASPSDNGAANQQRQEKLEQALQKIEKRLATATEKLQQAEREGSDTIDAFRTAVEKTTIKVSAAKQALQHYSEIESLENNSSDASKAGGDSSNTGKVQENTPGAAQDAIAKALAKRAAVATMTETEKLENAVSSLQKRLGKLEDKLATARANGDDNATILAETHEKLTIKLSDAKATLADQV